jgi:hypothetical protein
MIQNKLVNRSDIALYKQISSTVYDDVLNSTIIDAQFQDVAPLLGERLFNDVMTNPATYNDLLNGGTYDYNGITYTNYGLKAVISYYTYARYVYYGSNIDTPFSMVNKLEGSNSTPVSEKAKKDLYILNRDSAFKIWGSVKLFLERTKVELYTDSCKTKPNNTFKISKIV